MRNKLSQFLIVSLFLSSSPFLFSKESFFQERGLYRVEDYGIEPNGESISERLSQLVFEVSNAGGGTILFGSGIYIMGSGLTQEGRPIGRVRLYPNITFKGVEGTIIQANTSGSGFHAMFCTVDHSTANVSFENICFNTYIGTRNSNINDFRLAIILHWCKDVTIRNCKFIHDIGTIDTRYSHNQEDKDNGIYRVEGLTIDNCIFEGRILKDPGYKDITSLGICAQDAVVRNNKFLISGYPHINHYFPNCCLEIQGKDIFVYNNEFAGFTNAIDINTTDKYYNDRNINIYNNKILCYRGIALWCNQGRTINGVSISHNYFNLACDNPDRRVTGIKGSVVFVSHPTDSNGGVFCNIIVKNNNFDYRYYSQYYSSLSYGKWIKTPQHRYDERNGMTYEEFYSTITLGGLSSKRKNVFILNNRFQNCVFPCIYIGGRNSSEDHIIKGNSFEMCGQINNWYIVSLVNQGNNIMVCDNTIIADTKSSGKPRFCQAKWAGLSVSGFTSEDKVSFQNSFIQRNYAYKNGIIIDYENDIFLLKNSIDSNIVK